MGLNENLAVIVCGHIAKEKFPILRGLRDEPLDEEDSGWQFSCASGLDEHEDEAEVWFVKEVLLENPELIELINNPPGTLIQRSSESDHWVSEQS